MRGFGGLLWRLATVDVLSYEIGILLGFALLLLLIAAWYVYTVINRQKNIIRKKLFYKRNGGLLLEQQLQIAKFNGDKIKLFKSEELEKSTDNFSINRILGHGGHGKLAQFINEAVILSEIKHRNVFPLTWEMRLRIAIEIAGALSYLHATASCPIYHRDIKSSNILLDEKYRAKIADFGTSRLVAIDQTHLTTLVHGTFGYLDPEYFRSSKFTKKSDVYSFGVVLVELLTGKKPVSIIKVFKQQEEYHSLVLKEGSKSEIRIFADLANRCLDLNGKKCPTMREVRTKLEVIQMSKMTFVTEQNYVGVEIPYQDGSSEHEHVVSSSLIDNGSV
ncbi:putative protein kinase RLK-Pelle-WAK family [Rosa chinensis]|uniref:Protein kinase domain-containing protein n=1 Tax=Rosa chinensis TaxID=74649 RepID=A0A2P6PE89_ROSCH|nr:putative protein kinase RLK-Pelle-WAK family [Rosa chinensis]